MQKMGLNKLRKEFLDFFEGKEHLILPSFPLVPQKDPSLLIINSGMAPLKPYFMGIEKPPKKRMATCQKCIRTPDIENVGKTSRHGTYFEMLGNFSFGDYFKEEAISWAWEFLTKNLSVPTDKLWISVYQEDDEAYEIWNRRIGISAERIVRLGKADNFWEIGTGPCGPCSEIYFDRGENKGCGESECKPGCDCDRFVEIWNLVFTQFNKDAKGNYTKLEKPNIDTGMGLERLACMMQDANNLFEVDTVRNILNYICKIAGIKYGENDKKDISIRVITDHIRSTTMMVSDGIIPSNEGRGYVLRRLLRRASRHGRLLGIEGLFLYGVSKIVINESKDAYPELGEKANNIFEIIRTEEENFEKTVDNGLAILNEYINNAKSKGQKILSGEDAFELHGTYGFPFDLTREIAEEQGILVDEEGFIKNMKRHQEIARQAYKAGTNKGWDNSVVSKLESNTGTEFIGYNQLESSSIVTAIIKNNDIVETADTGDEIFFLLDKTPFYGESGGQIGDKGILECDCLKVYVENCKKINDGRYLHQGTVEKGSIKKGMTVKAKIDIARRLSTARNHTATHLLQKAIRNVLGDHVAQAGSLVEPSRLRFDFSHYSPVLKEELLTIEKEVNEKILAAVPVVSREMSIDEAKKLGAIALFGEKYGDVVRVISVDNYSMELCGGTHVSNSSQISLFKITNESGISAGVRRIEAITGKTAIEYFNEKEEIIEKTSAVLKSNPKNLLKRAEDLVTQLKDLEDEIETLRKELAGGMTKDVLSDVSEIEGIKYVTARFDNFDTEGLRNAGDRLKNKIESGVVILASSYKGKAIFIVMATEDAVKKGVHAGKIIKEVAKIAGGGGGGRPDLAQAGAVGVEKINEALTAVPEILKKQV